MSKSLIAFASLYLLIAASSSAMAKPKSYMVCLGKEEAKIHKENQGGPVYKLNQEIIGALVQLRDSIYMKKRYVDQVCSASYPSIKLLELLMTEKAVFFSIYTEKDTPKMLAVDRSTMEDLKVSSAPLFVGFVTQIQAGLSKPNCLVKHIPELEKFFEDMQYIQENVGIERIIKTMDSPKLIFKKLQSLDYKNLKC